VLHLLVFVDDLLLATDDDDLMDYVKQTLTANFEMTDMGPALKYLGWHITRDKEKGEMWISLEQRINRAVAEFQLQDATPTSAPLPTD